MSSPTKGKARPSDARTAGDEGPDGPATGVAAAVGEPDSGREKVLMSSDGDGSGKSQVPPPGPPTAPPGASSSSAAGRSGSDDGRPRVTAAARSDKGRVRPDNQDNYSIMPLEVRAPAEANTPNNLITSADTRYVIGRRGLMMGVFDGMGGVAGGQWAACEAARFVGHTLFEHRREVRSEARPTGQEPEKILESVLLRANERIYQHGHTQKPEWMGMGSTATVSWVVGNRLLVGQVGDSRAYIYCNGDLIQVTEDQTLVRALVKAGVLTPEQAAVHPRRTELLECLGPSQEVRPEVYEVVLPAHCRLLLCSDGLHGPLSDERIAEILAQPRLPGEICRQLTDAANARGGHDNITVIVADIDVPGSTTPVRVRCLTGSGNPLGDYAAGEESSSEHVSAEASEEQDAEVDSAPAGGGNPQISLLMWVLLILLVAGVAVLGVLVMRELLNQQPAGPGPGQGTPAAQSSALRWSADGSDSTRG